VEATITVASATSPGLFALLGGRSTETSLTISLVAPSQIPRGDDTFLAFTPMLVYDTEAFDREDSTGVVASSSTSTSTVTYSSSVKSIYLKTNFTKGGVDLDGRISQILATVPNTASSPSSRLTFKQPLPTPVECSDAMKVDGMVDLEVRLLDQDDSPIVFTDTTDPWILSVIIRWKEEIDADRLRTSDTLTKFR